MGEEYVYYSARDENGELQHYRCSTGSAGETLNRAFSELEELKTHVKYLLDNGQFFLSSIEGDSWTEDFVAWEEKAKKLI